MLLVCRGTAQILPRVMPRDARTVLGMRNAPNPSMRHPRGLVELGMALCAATVCAGTLLAASASAQDAGGADGGTPDINASTSAAKLLYPSPGALGVVLNPGLILQIEQAI